MIGVVNNELKGHGRKPTSFNVKHYPYICLKEVNKTTAKVRQHIRSLVGDLNTRPSIYNTK
jgi:hypothetical protein